MLSDAGSAPGLAELSLEALARAATSFPNSAYLDILAHRASGRSMDAEPLTVYCRSRPDTPALKADGFDGRALAWFGLAVGASANARRTDASTLDDVDAIFSAAARLLGGVGSLGPRMIRLWIEVLHHLGRLDAADPALKAAPAGANRLWCAATDALNPYLVDAQLPISPWLDELSRPFTDAGLTPLQLQDGDEAPFNRLTAAAEPISGVTLPLVSVVMPVYRPGPSLRNALRSVLEQTWTNLEIILSDDGSPPESRELLNECAQYDPRVQVVYSPTNRGAYSARNLGLRHANGEFVTFHDSDDWSHPQRIERQILPLLESVDLQATLSQALGVDADLGLTAYGRGPRRLNVSSLLFRRAPVLERLGGFDTVRRGADTEFLRRLETVFGPDAVHESDECLALVQLTVNSLSRNDYGLLRRHPARLEYRGLYARWHDLIADGTQSSFVLPPLRAPFPAPSHISGAAATPNLCDIVLLANLGAQRPSTLDVGREISGLAAEGRRVGLVHCPGPRDLVGSASDALAAVDAPSPSVAERIRAKVAFWAMPGERVGARLAIVRDPGALLTHADGVVTDLDVDDVMLIAGYSPSSSLGYDAIAVDAIVRDQLGAEPTWLPATAGIAGELTGQLGDARVLEPRLWAQVAEPIMTAHGPPPGPPIVGMLGTDVTTMPRDPTTRVWFRGHRGSATFGRPTVTVGTSDVSLEAFLQQVSYAVIPRSPALGPHLSPLAVAALQAGCIPVLDPSFKGHFGKAALYPSRSVDLDAWIRLHSVRPELYVEQQRTGLEFVARLSLATSYQEAAQA